MAKQSTELRELSDNDLVARLDEAKETYFNIRMNRATGQLENSSLLGSRVVRLLESTLCFVSGKSQLPKRRVGINHERRKSNP